MTEAHGESYLLDKYANLALDLGRLPTVADARLAISNGLEFPDWNTFTKQFGGKPQLVAKLREYCQARAEYAPVIVLCGTYAPCGRKESDEPQTDDQQIGYVYLLKHGSRREYKIGRTNNALRREGEISIELPEKAEPVHVIKTDDPTGIEAYWHKRFAEKRKNGEWFELNAAEVAAFKRRKFM